MNGHLVAVKVGIERRTHQGVQLNGFAFDQNRLKSLNAQTVQCRRAVEHHGMLFDHLFQDVPHHGTAGFDFLLRRLDGGRNAHGFKPREDEGLEELQGHQFGQTALVQLQSWTHGDHGTTRVVDALAQQVLTETSALAFDHVGQRLQGTLVGARHRFAATTVVQERIHRLLQHALLVSGNDLRRLQLKESTQTAVSVDHAAIQVVQVRGRKASAVQGHQGAQIGWQHGQHRQHHPLGLQARFLKGF